MTHLPSKLVRLGRGRFQGGNREAPPVDTGVFDASSCLFFFVAGLVVVGSVHVFVVVGPQARRQRLRVVHLTGVVVTLAALQELLVVVVGFGQQMSAARGIPDVIGRHL